MGKWGGGGGGGGGGALDIFREFIDINIAYVCWGSTQYDLSGQFEPQSLVRGSVLNAQLMSHC